MQRCFIVHGWGGYPDEAWMPWLDRELTAAGFAVQRLSMPHPDTPTIDDWVGALASAVGTPDADTHLVGHSIGCQTIIRYLAGLPENRNAGRVVYVAGWVQRGSLMNLEPEEIPVARPWVETPIDFERARSVSGPSLAILSDDDPVVVPDNDARFHELLGSEVVILHAKGHFSEDSGVTELPEARDFLLRQVVG
jgi:predicted alpha/beta hydrolase family esterase